MKTDYPELEGKKVKYVSSKKVYRGIVSGCNYHLGITIQEDKTKMYLACLIGKSSPTYKNFISNFSNALYRKIFHELVKQIQQGEVFTPKINKMITDNGSHILGGVPSAKTCPYAQ